MMPLYMNFWHVVNMNRCPPQKGGCGRNILVCAKPVEVNLEQKLPTSPDVDLNQFIKEVEHFYIRQRDGLARFNIAGTIVAVKFLVKIEKYPGTLDDWFKRDKKLKEKELKRYENRTHHPV